MDSSCACSSSESTRRIVEAAYCASTTRQRSRAYSRASDASPRGVQVVNGACEAGWLADELERDPSQREVLASHPGTGRLVVRANDGIEGAEQPDEECCELPCLRPGL